MNDKRVEDETGKRKRFSSRILPAYARRPRRWHVLAGLSGSGKSTVFGVLTGQRRLDPIPQRVSGRVLVDGHGFTPLAKSTQARLFALVPQNAQ